MGKSGGGGARRPSASVSERGTRTRTTATQTPKATRTRRTTLGREASAATVRAAIEREPLPARETPRANETAKGALSRIARDETKLAKWSDAHRAQLDERYVDASGDKVGLTRAAGQWRNVVGARVDILGEDRALWTASRSLQMSPDEHRALAAHFTQAAKSTRNGRRRSLSEALAAMHTHAADVKTRAPRAGAHPSTASPPRSAPRQMIARPAATNTFASVFRQRNGRAPGSVQSVSAALNKAGFERARTAQDRRNRPYVTTGYRVQKTPNDRRIWVDARSPQGALTREDQQRAIDRYATALRSAGYDVTDTGKGFLLAI
jgi:hypothetical protein